MDLRRLQGHPVLGESWPLPLDRPFHRQEALQAGVPRRWLGQLVETGHLRRPLRGVYVAAQVPDDLSLRIACLRLVVPDDVVVCDRHAGWIHGAPMVLAPGEHVTPGPVSLARYPGSSRIVRSEFSCARRALLAEDVTEIDGLLVTTRLRTALDLGRTRSRVAAISGIDAMLRAGVDHLELIDGVDRFAGERWITTLRDVAPLGNRLSASPGESACKLAWWDTTGTLPDLQIEVTGPTGAAAYLDLGSSEARFAVEYDGEAWHDSPLQVEHDRARRAHVREVHGFEIEVVRSADVYGAEQRIHQLIHAGLARSRRRLGGAA